MGAGIIALPVKTHDAGFIPTVVGLCFCWGLMYVSALLLLELSLWYGESANISSMAQDSLGTIAKLACVGVYLFVYGATLVAYIAEAPKFILPFMEATMGECSRNLSYVYVPQLISNWIFFAIVPLLHNLFRALV